MMLLMLVNSRMKNSELDEDMKVEPEQLEKFLEKKVVYSPKSSTALIVILQDVEKLENGVNFNKISDELRYQITI